MKVLVTGGAGFIGSAVCRLFVGELEISVLNVDKLTYAANLDSLRAIENHPNYAFRQADICDRPTISRLVAEFAPDAVLHLVGPRQLRVPADLQPGVVYHGFLSKSDPAQKARLDAVLRECVLFVMPSLYEPFGIAPLEAMAHQLPCVLTNRWALREMVEPGRTGELVECGNVEDLAEKLRALLQEPEQLRPMGEAARQFALERFTWDKVAKTMSRRYESLSGTGSSIPLVPFESKSGPF